MREMRRTTSRWNPSRVSFAHALMVVAGLLTFVLVASVLQDRNATLEVWVARSDLSAGSEVVANDLDVVEIDAADPLLGSLVEVAAGLPVGRLRDVVSAGEPILRRDLVAVDDVAAGRTFSVPIEASVLEGLGLAVRDRIDVIGLTGEDLIGYVVVDVAVTRLPMSAESSAFAAASTRSAWVTVEVSEQQALALSEAMRHGDLRLVRSTGAEPIRAMVGVDGVSS